MRTFPYSHIYMTLIPMSTRVCVCVSSEIIGWFAVFFRKQKAFITFFFVIFTLFAPQMALIHQDIECFNWLFSWLVVFFHFTVKSIFLNKYPVVAIPCQHRKYFQRPKYLCCTWKLLKLFTGVTKKKEKKMFCSRLRQHVNRAAVTFEAYDIRDLSKRSTLQLDGETGN